jgi:hypothetical protein
VCLRGILAVLELNNLKPEMKRSDVEFSWQAFAVARPIGGVGQVAALEALHLAFTALQTGLHPLFPQIPHRKKTRASTISDSRARLPPRFLVEVVKALSRTTSFQQPLSYLSVVPLLDQPDSKRSSCVLSVLSSKIFLMLYAGCGSVSNNLGRILRQNCCRN